MFTHQCCFYAMQMVQIISIRVSLKGYQGRYFFGPGKGASVIWGMIQILRCTILNVYAFPSMFQMKKYHFNKKINDFTERISNMYVEFYYFFKYVVC